MMALESLQHSTFTPLVGGVFMVKTGAGAELVLHAVKQLGHKRTEAMRDPFSLTFRGAPGLRIAQGIHRVECAALGALDIFITQVGAGPQGADFEAVFT
jgi:hypothetical protein